MLRFAENRARGQHGVALAAALILTACFGQRCTAQVTIQVNTTQQGVTNGQCSLQEAIYASEFKSNTAIGSTSPDTTYSTGCVAGTGNGDTIVLPPGAVFTFDHFWDGDANNIFGPTATPIIFSKITIEGNGATLQWQDRFGPGNSRLFAIGTGNGSDFASGTGSLTLRNVYVKGFHIKGGNGGSRRGWRLGRWWRDLCQWMLLSQSKTAPSRTTERWAATATAVMPVGHLSGGGGGECRETGARDVLLAAAEAAVRVVMVAKVGRFLQPSVYLKVAVEVAVAELFFRAGMAKATVRRGWWFWWISVRREWWGPSNNGHDSACPGAGGGGGGGEPNETCSVLFSARGWWPR